MRSRAARNAFAVLATLCVLAVPATALATTADDDHRSANAAEQQTGKPEKTEKADKGDNPAQGNSEEAQAEHGKPEAAPTDEPQPKSNADMNPGGANNGGDCGAYCSTRDGSPSENGKGDGEANGKPCAGCVGKADNKNPPGQAPDGTDHNAGYECDRNQGIGKTNPAHTGCKPTESPSVSPTATSSPCVPTTDHPCESASPCVPTNDVPCESESPSPSVSPSETQSPTPEVSATTTPSVKGVKLTRAAQPPAVIGSRLPTTGSNVSVALLLLVGLGLVGVGVSVTVATPARHH